MVYTVIRTRQIQMIADRTQEVQKKMKKFRNMIARMFGKKEKTQEQIRREFEEAQYDHYQAFGSAFVNFCSGR